MHPKTAYHNFLTTDLGAIISTMWAIMSLLSKKYYLFTVKKIFEVNRKSANFDCKNPRNDSYLIFHICMLSCDCSSWVATSAERRQPSTLDWAKESPAPTNTGLLDRQINISVVYLVPKNLIFFSTPNFSSLLLLIFFPTAKVLKGKRYCLHLPFYSTLYSSLQPWYSHPIFPTNQTNLYLPDSISSSITFNLKDILNICW